MYMMSSTKYFHGGISLVIPSHAVLMQAFPLVLEIIVFCIYILSDSSKSVFIYIILLNLNPHKAQGPNELSNLAQTTQPKAGGMVHIIHFFYLSHQSLSRGL